jgi:hypothetical protein
MALNTLVIYLSFCFVIVVSEEMTHSCGGVGDQGGISEMLGPEKESGIPKQREEYVLDDKTGGRTKKVTRKLKETCTYGGRERNDENLTCCTWPLA